MKFGVLIYSLLFAGLIAQAGVPTIDLPIEVGPELARHHAVFETMEIDPHLGLEEVSFGSVAIDTSSVTVSLLGRDAAGTLQPLRSITLPIVRIENSCGSVVITARRDRRPVDGALEEIVLADHRLRICDDLQPHMTTVTYNTAIVSRMTGEEGQTSSFFGGKKLEPIYE